MASSHKNRLLAVERVSNTEWRAVESEIGTESIRIIRADRIDTKEKPDFDGFAHKGHVALISNAKTAVCRLMQMADGTQDEIKSMVALRLETELPYPVEKSTWTFAKQNGGSELGGRVLVVATETESIEQTESALHDAGIKCDRVEFDGTALADLATSCRPESSSTVALTYLNGSDVAFVVVTNGMIQYVRRFGVSASPKDDLDTWQRYLVNEIDQSLYDYTCRTDGDMPAAILLAGPESKIPDTIDALHVRTGLDVSVAELPKSVDISGIDMSADELVGQYAVCMGAIFTAQRRIAGSAAATPPLRTASRSAIPSARRNLLILAAANVVVLCVFIAVSFSLRTAQLKAARRIIDTGRPMVLDIEPIEEEVNTLKFESGRQRSVLDILSALSELLPDGVKIDSLTIDKKGTLNISGTTKSVEDISDRTVSAMEASPLFQRPRFQGAAQEKSGYSFRITCLLSNTGGGSS